MPKQVTVRFYRIGKQSERGATLRQALFAADACGQPGARERQMSGAMTCRLERYVPTAGFISGEITRVKADDFPHEVHPHGTRRLAHDGPIGSGVAFRFREADHTLAIQFDNRIVSPSRFIDYAEQFHPAARFTIQPIADDEALARFREQPLRKVSIKLADPTEIHGVSDAMRSAASSFRQMGEQYHAPTITLSMGMGHEKGGLNAAAKRMVEGFIGVAGDGANVKSVRVTPDRGAGTNKDIDLLDALLSTKEELAEVPADPDQNYEMRARLLDRVLRARR